MAGISTCTNIMGGNPLDIPQFNQLAFGSFAAAITAATAVDLLTCNRDSVRLRIANTTDVSMVITLRLPGALSTSNVNVPLDAYATLTTTIEDIGTNQKCILSGMTIAAFAQAGVAPTLGALKVSVY